ncbi:NAD(+)/NADH kinase [Hydromonas duriensis]|uniref:NAD kinase n=1 Tax=Hydromonas duriensis TaxID=1527608 RepID=A0A4R6Y265_9BURK|nr:NAD(+)/NADH kinase [Hydromonas duriensis]TDR30593.1 NAD+ kinase [Hydromonas duriensis]
MNDFLTTTTADLRAHPYDIRTVALAGRLQADTSVEPLLQVIQTVLGLGKAVIIEEKTAQHFKLSQFPSVNLRDIGSCADVIIAVGGDGTMLGVARRVAPYQIPLIGVNQGHLGFITDISLADAPSVLREILLERSYDVEMRDLLYAEIIRNGEVVYHGTALNDVVVGRTGIGGMLELNVDVSGQFMYAQRADSLIIATPTGSTAYSLAANGPILHPQLAGITLAPVAPQSLSNRPIVLPNDSVIDIEIVSSHAAVVHFDVHAYAEACRGDVVRISPAPYKSIFWHPKSYNYYATLRQKLNWQLNPARPI